MPKSKPVEARRRARMLALQALFAADLGKTPAATTLDWLLAEEAAPAPVGEFAHHLVDEVAPRRAALDQLIQRYAPVWPVRQLSGVDRNTLRIALFELLYSSDTPRKTAINEAVELAKAFGSESSPRFVNGVLGSVMGGLERGDVVPEKPVPEGR